MELKVFFRTSIFRLKNIVLAGISLIVVNLFSSYVHAQTLLQQNNLVYSGSFRVPDLPNPNNGGPSSFDYCACVMTFDPNGNGGAGSLFIVGHGQGQMVAEISIPSIVNIAGSGNVNLLNMATYLQPFSDKIGAYNGVAKNTYPGGTVVVGGLMVQNNTLYETFYFYYDGIGGQQLSHFKMGKNLSVTNDVQGPYQVGISDPNCCSTAAGFSAGWMMPIPSNLQASLGGAYITGECCLGIVSRTSYGPSAFVWDPAKLGVVSPVPTTSLLYYNGAHHTLGDWGDTSRGFNGTTQIRGAVLPVGTKSLLFFGEQGIGTFCYGEGTSDPTLAGKTNPADGATYCYDPAGSAKGVHAYPYIYQVWAYNTDDLAAVKAGSKNPWDVVPYAYWQLNLPTVPPVNWPVQMSAAYDSVNQKIYVAQPYADGPDKGYLRPIIHVYQVQITGAPPPPAPPATPSNLLVK